MGGFALGPFTWEALATLTTGVLAVIAATVVAMRQTKIIAGQLRLQEMEFRNSVFDRRAAVYNDISRYISHIVYTEADPGFDLFERYWQARLSARFLFSEHLNSELAKLKEYTDATVEGLRETKIPNEIGAVSRRRLKELRRRYDALPLLFQPEMGLDIMSARVVSINDPDAP